MKYFKKIKKISIYSLTVLVIVTFLWAPFDNTFMANKIAYAQQSGQYTTGQNNFSSQNGPGISGYIKGLAPQIAQLPQCKAIIKSKVKTLFKNVKGVLSEKIKKEAAKAAAEEAKSAAAEASMIATFSKNEYQTAQKDYEKSVEIAEAQARQVENDLCLKSIGKLVAQRLIQKITLSTISWIQSGYEGKPFFIQNHGKFFADIAKNEILQFGGELNFGADCTATISGNLSGVSGSLNTNKNGCISPFAKDYFKNVVNKYNTKFQDNARYSLNELIQQTTPEYSGASFSADFSAGGWNAWDALTQVPANNPLGFQIMMSNELARRLEGTDTSTANKLKEDLDRASGFLGQEVCAEPEGLTRAQHDAALEQGDFDNTCQRWEYVTPGKMIADKAQKALGYQEDSLNNIEDLNGAVAALIDAVLAQFSSKIQEGFVGVTNEGADGSFIMNTYNADGNFIVSQTEKDFAPSQLNSKWLEENSDFNIRTDVNQALIDEQRIYSEKLTEQNLQIPQLIMDVRQLDYCIPGPNPKWEVTSSVDNFYDNINIRVDLKGFDLADTLLSIALPIGGAVLSSLIGFDPTAILSGVATALLDDAREKKIKAMMASYIGDLFEVHIYGAGQDDGIDNNGFGDQGHQDQVLDEGDVRSVIDNTWNSYADNIYKIYFTGTKSLAYIAGAMPLVTNEARNEFNKIEGYQKMAEDNYDVIQSRKALISRLTDIKDEIDTLNNALPAGMTLEEFWDTAEYMDGIDVDGDGSIILSPASPDIRGLTSIIAEFSRISNEMVSGNDIAEVDNVLKEIIDRRDYVWDDLLKGAGGCEAELEKFYYANENKSAKENDYSKYVRRQPYPLPVYYFYGSMYPDDAVGLPLAQVEWKKELVGNPNFISPSEGFLYGMVYYNRWAGPHGPSVSPAPNPNENMDGDKLINSDPAEWNIDGDKSPLPLGNQYQIIDDIPVEDTNLDGKLNMEGKTNVVGYPTDEVVYDKGNGVIDDLAPLFGTKNHYDCPEPPPWTNHAVGTPIQCDDDPDPYNRNVPFWFSNQTPQAGAGCFGPKPWPPHCKGFGDLDPHNPLGSEVVDENGDLVNIKSRMDLCPEYIQFPEDVDDDAKDVDGDGAYVEISLPSGVDDNNVPIDIGGLEPRGFGSDDPPNHRNNNLKDYRNICSVITRGFEKKFQVY